MTDYTIHGNSVKLRIKKRISKVYSKLDDLFMSAVLRLATVTHSEKLSKWIETRAEKQIQKLRREIIKLQWDQVTLKKALDEIHEKQHTEQSE